MDNQDFKVFQKFTTLPAMNDLDQLNHRSIVIPEKPKLKVISGFEQFMDAFTTEVEIEKVAPIFRPPQDYYGKVKMRKEMNEYWPKIN